MCFLHFLLMCSVVLLLCVLGNKNCADLVVQECAYVLLLLIQFTLTNLACLNTCLTKNAAVYTQRRRQATMIWGDYRRCTICCFNCLTTKLQKTSRPFISADKKIFRMIIFNFWLNMNDLNLPWWTQSQYSSALVFQGHDLVVQNVTKTSKVVQVMLLSESQEQKKKKSLAGFRVVRASKGFRLARNGSFISFHQNLIPKLTPTKTFPEAQNGKAYLLQWISNHNSSAVPELLDTSWNKTCNHVFFCN